ncbi:ATP-binding cassette domain-containing protein [Micromonospora sp. CPCC 206060]|uniref:ATP-binding cassette domain-containing protein n=1 Tax=Micromonospora sp. CPCC 206060 TaxID=3122406 RepID=UPI002FF12F7E
MSPSRVFEAEKITFRYGRKVALEQVSFDLGVGATVLLGRNGAGKSTLIAALVGAAQPVGGRVLLDGRVVGGGSRRGRGVLRDIGWLPQSFGFPPQMSVEEFVGYAGWLKEVPRARLAGRVSETISLVGLSDKARQALGTLSGGQLRRAGLAAAVVAEPAVLVLDEPTAGLDPEQREEFHDLVRTLRTRTVVLVATHLLEDVEALAQRIMVLDDGRLLWSGTPQELIELAGSESGLQGLRRGFQAVLGSAR